MMKTVISVTALALAGCSTAPRGPSAEVRASCPPLTDAPRRSDFDAQTRRVSEVEGWYTACREAALNDKRDAPVQVVVSSRWPASWGLGRD